MGLDPSQKVEGKEDGVDKEAEESHIAKHTTVTLAWICTQTNAPRVQLSEA